MLDVSTAAGGSSPVIEKSSLSFQHSNSPSSSSSSNEERTPKMPQNNGSVNTTPSSNADPMRVRALTTVPTVPKKPVDFTPVSSNPSLEMKRNMSDSVMCKFSYSSKLYFIIWC